MGHVIEKNENREIIISLQGSLVRAQSEIDLVKGSSHYFQVKSTAPVVELKIIDGPVSKYGSPLLTWISGRTGRQRFESILNELIKIPEQLKLSQDTSRVIQRLRQILPAIVFGGNTNDDNLWCSRFLLRSGLFWENMIGRLFSGMEKDSWKKLAASDLKGLLLSINKCVRAEDLDNDLIQSITLKIDEAISIIEQDQFLNLSCIKAGMAFWFIPGWAENGFKGAELFVKEIKENDEIYFSMFTEFSILGKIEMDISVVKSVISIKIIGEDKTKTDFIKQNIPVLEKAIHNLGLIKGDIVCEIMQGANYIMNLSSGRGNTCPSVHFVV